MCTPKNIIPKIKIFAKAWNIALIFFFLIILLGHIFGEDEISGAPNTSDYIAMFFFPTGVLIGIIISLKKEILGSTITIISMIVFFIIIIVPRDAYRMLPMIFLIITPSILNLFLYKTNSK